MNLRLVVEGYLNRVEKPIGCSFSWIALLLFDDFSWPLLELIDRAHAEPDKASYSEGIDGFTHNHIHNSACLEIWEWLILAVRARLRRCESVGTIMVCKWTSAVMMVRSVIRWTASILSYAIFAASGYLATSPLFWLSYKFLGLLPYIPRLLYWPWTKQAILIRLKAVYRLLHMQGVPREISVSLYSASNIWCQEWCSWNWATGANSKALNWDSIRNTGS